MFANDPRNAPEKPTLSLEDVMLFCRSERDDLTIQDRELFLLAIERSGLLLPHPALSVPYLLDRLGRSLSAGESFSLIRVGNGEGNAFSMTKARVFRPMEDAFFKEFNSQNHFPVDLASATDFCRDVTRAIENADMLGFRSFNGQEMRLVSKALESNNSYAALGITYARELLQNMLESDLMRSKVVTSAWIHLDLLSHIDELLSLGERVIVVSGRGELKVEFERRLGSRLVDFIDIPVQGHVPSSPQESHFYTAFPKTLVDLSGDLRGCLVLVGAGLFGKIYCDRARKSGAVAVDMGSAFDALGGHITRPVFRRYDIAKLAWLGDFSK